MRVKVLFAGLSCDVVAVVDGDECPAEMFIKDGEEATRGSREGLLRMLKLIAENGLQGVPAAWTHEANKKDRIYEVIKGPLRLFFFKGAGRQVTVCTSGARKKGQKADSASVAKAAAWRKEYEQAVADKTLKVVNDDDDDNQ